MYILLCENIWQELNKECINLPQTADEWKQRSQEFLDMWQHPFALVTFNCYIKCKHDTFKMFNFHAEETKVSNEENMGAQVASH